MQDTDESVDSTSRVLVSSMMLVHLSNKGKSLKLGHYDISRAYFQGTTERLIYIRLPAEDRQKYDEDKVGRLDKSMYGTQDASHIWQLGYANLICAESGSFRRGKHSAALFHNPNYLYLFLCLQLFLCFLCLQFFHCELFFLCCFVFSLFFIFFFTFFTCFTLVFHFFSFFDFFAFFVFFPFVFRIVHCFFSVFFICFRFFSIFCIFFFLSIELFFLSCVRCGCVLCEVWVCVVFKIFVGASKIWPHTLSRTSAGPPKFSLFIPSPTRVFILVSLLLVLFR